MKNCAATPNSAVVPPCMMAVPKPADDPDADIRVGGGVQVVEVLDDGKARANGKAHYGGVNRKADAVAHEEIHKGARLQQLFHDRRDVVAVAGEIEAADLHRPIVGDVADAGEQRAGDQRLGDLAQAHQLVAVELQQHEQKDHDRQKRDRCRQ